MSLNVPNLLLVSEDVGDDVETAFSDMVRSFIQENELQQIIIEQALMIVVRFAFFVSDHDY